jgi:hypothetical protein
LRQNAQERGADVVEFAGRTQQLAQGADATMFVRRALVVAVRAAFVLLRDGDRARWADCGIQGYDFFSAHVLTRPLFVNTWNGSHFSPLNGTVKLILMLVNARCETPKRSRFGRLLMKRRNACDTIFLGAFAPVSDLLFELEIQCSFIFARGSLPETSAFLCS